MTRLLLDTHAFVWAAIAPARLGAEARELMVDPTNDLLVSAATAWELATKVRRGRFADAEPLVARFAGVVTELGAQDLDITVGDALRAGGLDWDHRDPFDRMLAAQSMERNVVLVTGDRAFASIRGLRLVW